MFLQLSVLELGGFCLHFFGGSTCATATCSLDISTKWASNFAKRSGGAKTAAGETFVNVHGVTFHVRA